jgi:hypothetical protein
MLRRGQSLKRLILLVENLNIGKRTVVLLCPAHNFETFRVKSSLNPSENNAGSIGKDRVQAAADLTIRNQL